MLYVLTAAHIKTESENSFQSVLNTGSYAEALGVVHQKLGKSYTLIDWAEAKNSSAKAA
jgi:hypothetical protein